MKKILLSILTIALVSSVAIGATKAYFSDSATSAGNTFAAGTLDLTVNGTDSATKTYTLNNIHPGSWDDAGQVVLKNTGSLKGHVWYEITNVKNYENSCLSAETGDTTCGAGSNQGELGNFAKASLQENVAPWTRFPVAGSLTSINAAVGTHYDIGDLNPGDSLPVVLYGVWTSSANDNIAQGDSVTFDVVFHIDQD